MGQLIFRLLDSLVPAVLEAVEQGARSFPPCNLRARTLKGACWDVASGSLRGDRPREALGDFPLTQPLLTKLLHFRHELTCGHGPPIRFLFLSCLLDPPDLRKGGADQISMVIRLVSFADSHRA